MNRSPGFSAFSDDEDDCETAGEAYESGDDSSNEEFQAAGADSTRKKAAPVADTPASAIAGVSGPVLAMSNVFDSLQAAEAPKTSGTDQIAAEKIAMAVAEAVRGQLGPKSPIDDGSKVLKVTLGFSGSLKDLVGKNSQMRLVCKNKEIAKALGGEEAPLREITILSYENKFPVSLGLSADHLRGNKFNTHVTDTGFHMIEMKANTSESFGDKPVKVYGCLDSKFKRQTAQHFPNVKQADIGTDVVPMGNIHPSYKFVPATSIVMVGIQEEIKHATKKAAEKAEKYSGEMPQLIKELGVYKVTNNLVVSAINLLQKSFAETDDSVNVTQDLFFVAERSRVSDAALEKRESRAAESMWADPRELKHSLKSGHTLDNQLAKVGEVSITIAVKISA